MKAITTVLQNDGYIIKNIDTQFCFINAIKEEPRIYREIGKVPLKDTYEASINVSNAGDKMEVRINVKYDCMNTGTQRYFGSTEIKNPEFYREFFNKLDKEIGLVGEN